MGTLDTLEFASAVTGLPEQLAEARNRAGVSDISMVEVKRGFDSVVVCGMGGSGFSGDVVAATVGSVMRTPLVVTKGYELPAFVGPRTLVFAVSYSGSTEETLTAASSAARSGAPMVAVTTGGPLAQLAAESGAATMLCPAGFQPRAAIGMLVAPILVTLERLGLFSGASDAIEAAITQLALRRDQCRTEVDWPKNPARELARRIGRTIPLIYGGGAVGAAAAMRWKTEINENAKAPAFWNTYPELDHNEICGWGQHGDVTRQVFSLIELRHDFEHSQIGRRFEVTREIIDETLAQTLSVVAEGAGPLAQILDLAYVGAWTSVYLAFDAGVDPGPVDAIARLKHQLSKGVSS